MSKLANLPDARPPLESLPIPDDVQVNDSWSASMREMADHIGARAVLLLAERLGGLQLYIPVNPPENWHVARIIGAEAAATLARVYAPELLDLPVCTRELFDARAAPILAAVRADQMTYTDAAWLLHTSRKHVWHLAHHSRAESRAKSKAAAERRQRQADEARNQIDLFKGA